MSALEVRQVLNKLQEAIAAGRHAIDLLEVQLAELIEGSPTYFVGSQGRYELAHRTLRPYATALQALDLHHAMHAEPATPTPDAADDLQDSMTTLELRELLRSAAPARLAAWGSQGYEGDTFTDADGILDPFDDFFLTPALNKPNVA